MRSCRELNVDPIDPQGADPLPADIRDALDSIHDQIENALTCIEQGVKGAVDVRECVGWRVRGVVQFPTCP